MASKPWVCIIMGSDSDAAVMSQACDALDELGIGYEMKVASAHLPGVVASFTSKPVIGVPLAGGALQGFDALLAVVQMPPGIPVATVAVVGARNAGILAAQILAVADSTIAERLK